MSKCTESPEKTLAPSDKDLDADVEGEDKVTFIIGGQHTDEDVEATKNRTDDVQTKKKRRKKKRSKSKKYSNSFTEEELRLRSVRGSELAFNAYGIPTDKDEANVLENKDLEEISHHRFDHFQGLSKHLIRKKSSSAVLNIKKETGTREAEEHQKNIMDKIYGVPKHVDHR